MNVFLFLHESSRLGAVMHYAADVVRYTVIVVISSFLRHEIVQRFFLKFSEK